MDRTIGPGSKAQKAWGTPYRTASLAYTLFFFIFLIFHITNIGKDDKELSLLHGNIESFFLRSWGRNWPKNLKIDLLDVVILWAIAIGTIVFGQLGMSWKDAVLFLYLFDIRGSLCLLWGIFDWSLTWQGKNSRLFFIGDIFKSFFDLDFHILQSPNSCW